MKIYRLLFALSLLAGVVHAAEPTFDTWADAFAAEWMRGNPTAATTVQYFTGAEQDALDRQLTPHHEGIPRRPRGPGAARSGGACQV